MKYNSTLLRRFFYDGTIHVDGFVLVAVIWIAGLLTVVATTFSIIVKSYTVSGLRSVYVAQAEYVADGMALNAALNLVNARSAGHPISANGVATQCSWSREVAVNQAIQDQGGLVDLNTAYPDLLFATLEGLGLTTSQARAVVNSMQDYRDPDSFTADGRPEPPMYPGKSFGPKNAPFEITEEIDQLPEVNDIIFKKMLPLVTVYSQQTGIDPSVAPAALLDALAKHPHVLAANSHGISPTSASIFRIGINVLLRNGTAFYRSAVISISSRPDRPFIILEWTVGRFDRAVGSFPRTAPPCIS